MERQVEERNKLKRGHQGKWLPYGDKPFVSLGVKVEEETKERLNRLIPRKEKGDFLREAIKKALDEYEKN